MKAGFHGDASAVHVRYMRGDDRSLRSRPPMCQTADAAACYQQIHGLLFGVRPMPFVNVHTPEACNAVRCRTMCLHNPASGGGLDCSAASRDLPQAAAPDRAALHQDGSQYRLPACQPVWPTCA